MLHYNSELKRKFKCLPPIVVFDVVARHTPEMTYLPDSHKWATIREVAVSAST